MGEAAKTLLTNTVKEWTKFTVERERMIRTAESFSPWGYSLATPTQPLARG